MRDGRGDSLSVSNSARVERLSPRPAARLARVDPPPQGAGEADSMPGDVCGYRGARFAKIRCSVRRCMLSRRAVSETLRLHIS